MTVSIRKDATRDIHNLARRCRGFALQARQPIENLDRHVTAATADGGTAEITAGWAAHPNLQALVDALRTFGAS